MAVSWAGLAASAAFALFAIAYGVDPAQRMLRVHPRVLLAAGLLLAVGSGAVALLWGLPFMTGVWGGFELPAIGKIGTPLMFDVGVYLVVVGMVLMIIFELAEE